MLYTAKDVCKIYNINRETLRYYEKEGLINPHVDERNHYRYYDEWDINYIGECRKYRSMGFTIKEIKEVLTKDNLEDFIAKMECKQKDIERQLHFYALWKSRNQEYIRALKCIKPRIGQYEFVMAAPRYILPYRRQYDQLMDKNTMQAMTDIMEHHTFVDSMLFIPHEDYEQGNGNFYWGYSIREDWADELAYPKENYTYFPRQQCLRTTIDAGDKGNLSYHLFEGVNKYMEHHRFELCGDIYGILLTRVHEDGNYCRYLEMYFPFRAL